MERDFEQWLEVLYNVLKLAKNVDLSLSCIPLRTRKEKKLLSVLLMLLGTISKNLEKTWIAKEDEVLPCALFHAELRSCLVSPLHSLPNTSERHGSFLSHSMALRSWFSLIQFFFLIFGPCFVGMACMS